MSLPKYALYNKNNDLWEIVGTVFTEDDAKLICGAVNTIGGDWTYFHFNSFESAPSCIPVNKYSKGQQLIIQVPGFHEVMRAKLVEYVNHSMIIVCIEPTRWTATVPTSWVLGELNEMGKS
jgi:hypothetical protein